MPVVGSGDENGVHILVVEQAPEILVQLRMAADACRGFVEARRIDVAQRHRARRAQGAVARAAEVGARLGGTAGFSAQEAAAASADGDVAEVDTVAGCALRGHVGGDYVESDETGLVA